MHILIHCLCNGVPPKHLYPEKVRMFCVSMFNISPKSYSFLRETFRKNLPHPSTIRQWYRNSNINATSGLTRVSFNLIKQKAKEMLENENKQMLLSLSMDEMHIMRDMVWCRSTNKFIGTIDYGNPKKKDEFDLATNVIAFMVVGINCNLQQPVAYFFIQNLNYKERAHLLMLVLKELVDCGARVTNVTFDGLRSNIKMCTLLGVDLSNSDGEYCTFFENPYDKNKVYTVLDPSHMIKLMRNYIGSRGVIYDGEKRKIKWQYFIDLVEYNQTNDFGMSNKLNKRHIEYSDRRMHVLTAVQTLSSSTADCFEYLREQGLPQFSDVTATAVYTRFMDQIWDIMNTTGITSNDKPGKSYKIAMNPNNSAEIFEFLLRAKEYVASLQIIGKNSKKRIKGIKSSLCTGFIGLLMNIHSFMNMYKEFIEEHHMLLFLATYRFSQDHLEMLFGKIRALNGSNDNPNPQQFMGAYKKLLFNAGIAVSKESNVKPQFVLDILTVPSTWSALHVKDSTDVSTVAMIMPEVNPENPDDDTFDIVQLLLAQLGVSSTADAAIAHMATVIESRVRNCKDVYCTQCISDLNESEKIDDNICLNPCGTKPCLSTFKICKATDLIINKYINTGPELKKKVYDLVWATLDWDDLFTNFGENHEQKHKTYLVKYFIDEYTNLKCSFIAKQTKIATQKKYLRKRLRKLTHFKHQ